MRQSIFLRRLPHGSSHSASQKRTKLRRGQSLVEMAISMVILILLFQGVWDLGRAYYALVMLNNAASEGAHWAANYPGCLGAYFGANSAGGYPWCYYNNSVVGRIINEEASLDQNNFIKVCATTLDASNSSSNQTPTNNNTVSVEVVYKHSFVTPLITGLFGSTVNLTANVSETIRGSWSDRPSVTVISPAPSPNTYQASVPSSPTCP